jgi:hypothetical protein
MQIDILWLVVFAVGGLIVLAAAYSERKSYLLKKKEMERAIASYRLMEERADAARRAARAERMTYERISTPVQKAPTVTSKTTTRRSEPTYSRSVATDSDEVANMIMMNNMVAAMDTTPSYSYSSSSSDDSCSRSSYESSSSSSYSSYSSSDSSSSYSSSDSGSSSSGCD